MEILKDNQVKEIAFYKKNSKEINSRASSKNCIKEMLQVSKEAQKDYVKA